MAQVRILLVFDDTVMAGYLREKLTVNAGYSVTLESNASLAVEVFKEKTFDLVIFKFGMPDFDTLEFVSNLKKFDPDCVIITFIEDESEPGFQKYISRLSIYDFVSMPVNFEKLFLLIKKGADLHTLLIANRKLTQSIQEQNIALQKQNTLLAKRIEESTKNLTRLYEDLRSTYMRTIKVLAQAIDARDHYTHSHSQNVAKYAVAIAQEMNLSASEIILIRDACELHDLGKIGIDDSILSKPSELTADEFELMKKHPMTAANIL